MSSVRASCWSITINNPSEVDLQPVLPSGWSLTGQMEKGSEKETLHYQGMLKTPQVRFSSVKKVFPRAHIEAAKNSAALEAYVHKDDTRIATVPDMASTIPSLFNYQETIANMWNDEEWDECTRIHEELFGKSVGDVILKYVDSLIARQIAEGAKGVEYIGVNPMWRQTWKIYGLQIVARQRKISASNIIEDATLRTDVQEGEEVMDVQSVSTEI